MWRNALLIAIITASCGTGTGPTYVDLPAQSTTEVLHLDLGRELCFDVADSFKQRFADDEAAYVGRPMLRWEYLLRAAAYTWRQDVFFGSGPNCWKVEVSNAGSVHHPNAVGRVDPCEKKILVDDAPTRPIVPFCGDDNWGLLNTALVIHEVGHTLGFYDDYGNEGDVMSVPEDCEILWPTEAQVAAAAPWPTTWYNELGCK